MITVDSKLKDIFQYPEAKKVVNDAMAPVMEATGQEGDYSELGSLTRAFNMTLRALAGFPQSGITPEIFADIEEKLEELEIEEDDEE